MTIERPRPYKDPAKDTDDDLGDHIRNIFSRLTSAAGLLIFSAIIIGVCYWLLYG